METTNAPDRGRILDEVYQGYGSAINLPWPEYPPAYDAEGNSRHERDLDKVRELVEKVGHISDIPLTYSSDNRQISTVAQVIADNLAETGIGVRLEAVESATSLSNLRNGTNPRIWVTNHTFSQCNPSTLVASAFPFNSEKNGSNFVDEAYAEHVAEAWVLPDPGSAEAVEAYRKINDDLLDNAFVIELISTNSASVSIAELEGVG